MRLYILKLDFMDLSYAQTEFKRFNQMLTLSLQKMQESWQEPSKRTEAWTLVRRMMNQVEPSGTWILWQNCALVGFGVCCVKTDEPKCYDFHSLLWVSLHSLQKLVVGEWAKNKQTKKKLLCFHITSLGC